MRLVFPNKKYLKDYEKAYQEYINNNEHHYVFDNPKEINIIEKFYNYRKGISLPKDRVPMTTYWAINENNEMIGQISIRHQLTPFLLNYGGHIGYGIRIPFWRKGYGTEMLHLALLKAKKLGLKEVLITCDDDNIGSARVIEKNGGVLENKVRNIIDNREITTRRYWITL